MGRDHLAVYLGIMGPQDGVDQALLAFSELVHTLGRKDCHFALLGFGDCLQDLKDLARQLDLDDYVTFTGRVGPSEIADYLSTADVGICPDPKSPLNDVSTMNKTMEYMAYCVPVVSFDLAETRVSAGDCAIYLDSGDIAGFAAAWSGLLDDPADRVRRGLMARQRVSEELDWYAQSLSYIDVWRTVLKDDLTALAPPVASRGSALSPSGRRYIDLEDAAELERFISTRASAGESTTPA
jgi:glycosyltransferase involved in cell wall biosynthesis